MLKPSSPENTDRVIKAVAFLREIPIEGRFDYGLLRQRTGIEVPKQRYLLDRAFKILNEEDGAMFANVFGVGYERLPGDRTGEVTSAARRAIRGKAKRTVRKIRNVSAKVNNLSPVTNARIGAEIAVLGLIGRAAEDRTIEMVSKTPGFEYRDEPHSMRAFADYLSRT